MRPGTIPGLLALVLAVATAALWFHQIDRVAIPENRTAFVVFFLASVALGVGAFVVGVRWLGGVAAVLGILIGGFFPLSIAISRQEVAANAIAVGDTIPHFAALDENGERFDSDSLRGHPVLIKFFRGHW